MYDVDYLQHFKVNSYKIMQQEPLRNSLSVKAVNRFCYIQKQILYEVNLLYLLKYIVYFVICSYFLFIYKILMQNMSDSLWMSTMYMFSVLACTKQPTPGLTVSTNVFSILIYSSMLASTKKYIQGLSVYHSVVRA